MPGRTRLHYNNTTEVHDMNTSTTTTCNNGVCGLTWSPAARKAQDLKDKRRAKAVAKNMVLVNACNRGQFNAKR